MLAMTLALVLATGCDSIKGNQGKPSSTEINNMELKDLISIKLVINDNVPEEYKKLQENARENGYDIEFVVFPHPQPGVPDKLLVSLMSGDELDVVYSSSANLRAYYAGNVVEPLDKYANIQNDNLQGIFGDYLMQFDDKIIALPAFVDIAITIYNKKLFDDKGISYPSFEDWTWEKYVETALKITDKDHNIWGSYMPAWQHYDFMLALQKGVSMYNEDGKSNIDNPAFTEALIFSKSLGNKLEIQPSHLIHLSKNLPVDYFMQGNVGMTVVGAWALGEWCINKTRYPRDWQIGIAPMPYPEGYPPSASTVTGGYWIPTTSKTKDDAYQFIKYIAETQFELGYGRIPARIDLTDEQKKEYISNFSCIFEKTDNLSTESFINIFFNKETHYFDEKPVGTAAQVLLNLYALEGQQYALDEQTLEYTIKKIHEGFNEAIDTELLK